MSEPGTQADSREFARIPVDLGVRFRVVDATRFEEVHRRILRAPTVWAPRDEGSLQALAAGSNPGHESILAQALLDVSEQVRRLSYRVLSKGRPMEAGTVVQLSGSGCLLSTHLLLQPGTLLELQIEDDDDGVPPVRAGAEIVHASGPPGGRYGVKFVVLHPADQDRLVRYLYRIQRRALRKTSRD